MKKVTICIVSIFVLMFSPLSAKEYSGKNLKKIISEVDSTIVSYENNTAGYTESKESREKNIDVISKKILSTENEMQKEAYFADLLVEHAHLNNTDINFVKNTNKTLFQLVPRLNRLADEISRASRNGFVTSSDYRFYQTKVKTFIDNSSNVLKSIIKNVDNDKTKTHVRDAISSLQSANFRLTNNNNSGASNASEVFETVRLLETSIAQLATVESLLISERQNIRISGYQGLVRCVLKRMGGNEIFSTNKLPQFVQTTMKNIQDRSKRLNSITGFVQGESQIVDESYLSKNDLEKMLEEISN